MKEESYHHSESRYFYDLKYTPRNGWSQVDTAQDASYFGTWANPFTLQTFCYCEGDCTQVSCENEEEFKEEMHRLIAWNQEAGYWKGIDGMCNDRLIARWQELGFGEYLH